MNYIKGHWLLAGGVLLGILVGVWLLGVGINSLRADGAEPRDRVSGYEDEPTLGSASSPSVIDGCIDVEGIRTCYRKQAMRQATSTVCALRAPAATSTLVWGGISVRTASSSATIWDLAKASSGFATTTIIATSTIAASAQGAIAAASTTNATTTQALANIQSFAWTQESARRIIADRIFGPREYFVVGVRAGISNSDTAGTGFVPVGTCSASFQVLE